MPLTAVELLTGRGYNGAYREHMAQVRNVVILSNGFDANQAFSIRNRTVYDIGLAAPGAAPGAVAGSAGNVLGTVRYRVRWRDALTGAFSLPSSSVSITVTSKQVTVSQPASPPARATHWIVERTLDGAATFFPVNRTDAAPDGTAIATTTFVDDVADNTLKDRTNLPENQGVPPPYRWCVAHDNIIWMGGRTEHRVTATVTNGSPTVTLTGAFKTHMAGWFMSVAADQDGRMYGVESATADALTLKSNYAGATGSKVITVATLGNQGAYSERGLPEHFGEQEFGTLSNIVILGREPLTGGAGLGPGGFLWASQSRLYMHSYTTHPGPWKGGKIVQLPQRRGCVGPLAIKNINGWVYAIDRDGIWRMGPDGSIEDIGMPFHYDWQRGVLNWDYADRWMIEADPVNRKVYFLVAEYDHTYPKKALVWNENLQIWDDSPSWPRGVSAALVLPDRDLFRRLTVYHQALTGAAGTANSNHWCTGIGRALGAPPGTAPLNGTVTGGSSSTLDCTGAAFPTSGRKLAGVVVALVRAADASLERRVISDNDADTLTITPNWTGAAPANGDTFRIGEIRALYRSPRLNAGIFERKKIWKYLILWLKYKTSCTALNVRVFLDGKATQRSAETDRLAITEDGLTQVAGADYVTVDPTALNGSSQPYYRAEIPLNGARAVDLQVELFSDKAGGPWEVLGIEVVCEPEDSEEPRR